MHQAYCGTKFGMSPTNNNIIILNNVCIGMKDLHVFVYVGVFELYTVGEAEYRPRVRGRERGIDGSHLKRGS